MVNASIDVSARYRELLELADDHRLLQYQGTWTTVGRLRETVQCIQRILAEANLGPGTKIGLVTRNRPPQVATIVATLASERTLVPITSIQSDSGVAADVERTGVSVLVADQEDWAREGLVRRCAELGVLGILVSAAADEPVRVVDGLAASTAESASDPGIAVLMPTSGTTGPPKRIVYRYDHLNGALSRIARYAPATSRSLTGPVRPQRGVVIATLALAHVGGFWAVLQALAEGRAIALLDRFEPHAWADLVEEHSAKLASLPPSTIRMVLDADIPPEKIKSLRAVNCGTAPLDPDLGDTFTARYGTPVLTAYGATEFPGGLVGWNLADYREFHDAKRGSAGRARPGIKIRIVDRETGAELPVGEQGLVSVHSPQATTATEDGWVRTNDIARMDADGFLWILGRADDAINRGGFKIVPQVVEAVLARHPAVTDAAVVGLPDSRLGQVPVAAVTTNGAVTPAELVAWCREHLAKYQVPVEIRIVSDLPRTTSMKVSKDGTRALFATAR
ncbi:MAG TPA: long-chain fatty acid--CoA ligase [Amycolatopsis sp.]|nr:long-chain fatty acid--CoA ligase [Amycolatopsis sp.]